MGWVIMQKISPFRLDVLIFDMDGVLIDVSKSYRETIRWTVYVYLKSCLGFQKAQLRWVSPADISLFKSAGGFNNDWELTSGLLLYLLSFSNLPPSSRRLKFSKVEEAVRHLKMASSKGTLPNVLDPKKEQLHSFIDAVRSSGGGLAGVQRTLRKTSAASWDGWIYRTGGLGQENLVQRIFQEIYLGDQFERHYHLQPIFYEGAGFHLRERCLIPQEILKRLHRRLRLSIASGRPRFEAELALSRFKLSPYFDSVVTLDECEAEEARLWRSTGKRIKLLKPHPYSLLRALRDLGLTRPRCGYVGDTGDDMRAAQTASQELPMRPIGFLCYSMKREADREALLKAGADLVIERPRQLLKLIR